MTWRRGFIRLWVVGTIIWVWYAYTTFGFWPVVADLLHHPPDFTAAGNKETLWVLAAAGFGPPLAVLAAGLFVAWILSGFRPAKEPPPIQKGWKKSLASIAGLVGFVIAYPISKDLTAAWFSPPSVQEASKTVSAEFDSRLKEAQQTATANNTATDILMDSGKKELRAALENAKTDKDKEIAASSRLFGAYMVNIYTRKQYCGSLGVNIDNFIDAYKKQNYDLFIAAEKFLTEYYSGYDDNKLYTLMEPTLNKYIVQDMRDASAKYKMSETGLCQSLSQRPADWASSMDLRKIMPEVSQVLLK